MERTRLLVLVVVVFNLFIIRNVVCYVRVDPLVLINGQGLVRGYRATDGDYSVFLGVPYAKVDPEDPFGPAQEPIPFDEVIYYARDGSVKCPQMTNEHSLSDNEDLDWPYGFMCLDIPEVPGNQGLKDQYAALRWIRSHISSFGGNPFNMTVAGQDAGATSVLLHIYADKDRYFRKAIVESGTPQSEGMFVSSDENVAIKIAGHLGVNTTDTTEALEFLKTTPHELVTAAAYELNLQLKPCRERSFSGVDIFVQNDPYSLTNTRSFRTSILIGYSSNERHSLSSEYFDSDPFYEKLQNNFNLSDEVLQNSANIVRQFYIGDNALSEEVAKELEMFESDFGSYHPTERQITHLLQENLSEIYQYLYSYVGNTDANGVSRTSEPNYLIKMEGVRITEDQLVLDRLTTLWTNFVKYGNPTPSTTELIPLRWTPVTDGSRPTMIIDTDLRMESRVFQERMAFWDLFYSMYGNMAKLLRNCSDNPYICC
ncbi:unnamed protein product [Arctia plantaginis]|uniref:Carboxylesterase type B domain-containing protein n=1 Tax=Arctia plantaginis TaxID=874455 RepID=A0A8S1BCQ9_ARCPL|nr:unnamed protein product [Arctia plantaginis]